MENTAAIVALHHTPHLGPQGLRTILAQAALPGHSVQEAFDLSSEELADEYHLHPKARAALVADREGLLARGRALARRLEDAGVCVLTPLDARYPARLRALPDAPPVLYALGCVELLAGEAVGLVASASPGPQVLAIGRSIARRLAEAEVPLVAGHNKPLYQVCVLEARRAGSPCLVVLDRGLLRAFAGQLRRQPVAAARIYGFEFDPDRSLALSPFRPEDPWVGDNSRLRDHLVVRLAAAVVAVQVREGGVMQAACREALEDGARLFVCCFEGSGTGCQTLLAQGADPLDVDERGGLQDFDPLWQALGWPVGGRTGARRQGLDTDPGAE